ncbi:MAG: wax ester/triacylglycerol synthase family O-acyltransferase [Candidatus Dormiibacterota bacterium]
MSVQDAVFLDVENGSNPMHIGSVAVLDGPVPAYGDLVRLIAAKLPLVPRYRQKVRTALGGIGRPVWVDDPHFQILYHIRHTAIPPPGGRDELRNLAGRVFAQLLDRSKPLWELWMVEGLEDGRWAIISKVHHCMVDGVAATDLLTVLFDSSDASEEVEPPEEWLPDPEPGRLTLAARGVLETLADPIGSLRNVTGVMHLTAAPMTRLTDAAVLVRSLADWGKRSATSLNGPIGPHRRWSWAEASLDDVKVVRAGLGGTVNDVVLASIAAGFRALLEHRGEDLSNRVVRTLVPVSVRAEHERGTLNNRVSAMFPGLPVSIDDPVERLAAISEQLSMLKSSKQAVAGDALVRLAGFAPPMLLAMGARLAARTPQRALQTVTTNVPGPQDPLYVAGRRMLYSYPYVPIMGSVRISIAIFSYCGRLFFGITGDYDTVSDIDVLRDGIEAGLQELVAASGGASSPAPRRRARSKARAPRPRAARGQAASAAPRSGKR